MNLIVSAVNYALERRVFTLEANSPVGEDVIEFYLDDHPVIVHCADAGFDEVRVQVIACPTDEGRRFAHACILHEWRRFGMALTFCWVERRDGKYLQTGFNYNGTRDMTCFLAELKVVPKGFATKVPKGCYDFHDEHERAFGRKRK